MANPVKKKKPTIQGVNVLKAAVVGGEDNKAFNDSVAMYENYLDQMRWLQDQGFTQSAPTTYGGFMGRLGSGQGADSSWERQEDKKFVVDRTGRTGFYSNYSDKPVGDERVYDLDNPEDAAYVASLRDGDSFYEYDDEGFGKYVQDDMDTYFDPESNKFVRRQRPPDMLFREDMQQAGTATFKSPLGETYTLGVYAKPEGYDQYKKAKNRVGKVTPIAAKQLQNTYEKPALKPMTPVKTPKGRATVQVGKLAQDQKNARYGQVLDKEYYWDRELKKWQMRPVDEERKGQPMIRASF